jgi:hypothetical protein
VDGYLLVERSFKLNSLPSVSVSGLIRLCSFLHFARRFGVIANRQKTSVAHELLDDLSKDVIRNDRNLQLWFANAAANNLRAKLANEATPTPVYT